jgi:hypothetical protein
VVAVYQRMPAVLTPTATQQLFLRLQVVEDAQGEYTVPRVVRHRAFGGLWLWVASGALSGRAQPMAAPPRPSHLRRPAGDELHNPAGFRVHAPAICAQGASGLGTSAVAAKLLSGAVAGVCSRSVTAPIDRLKMLLQARAFPSWSRSTLTEIYLCHACSDHEILRAGPPRAGRGPAAAARERDLERGGGGRRAGVLERQRCQLPEDRPRDGCQVRGLRRTQGGARRGSVGSDRHRAVCVGGARGRLGAAGNLPDGDRQDSAGAVRGAP